MKVKTGKILGLSAGLFLASSMIIFVNAWTMFYAWFFVVVGLYIGAKLDRQGTTPEVSLVKKIIITPTIVILAVAVPLALRYAEFAYLSSQTPTHSSMRLVEKSLSPLAGDGHAGFAELYTTTESADVIYSYYLNELGKRGWKVGKRSGWYVDKNSQHYVTADGFTVKFSDAVNALWISYGSPHLRNIDIPKGSYPVTISHQRRTL